MGREAGDQDRGERAKLCWGSALSEMEERATERVLAEEWHELTFIFK